MEQKYDNANAWERSLELLARQFEYPATPDMAGASRPKAPTNRRRPGQSGRRFAWAFVTIALFLAALLAVPQTRAAVLSLFTRIGAIDIFIDEAAPTPRPTADETGSIAPPAASPVASIMPTATISGAISHSMSLIDLGEPVALEEARRLTGVDLGFPAILGEPDEVYTHRNVDLPAVTFVWREEGSEPLSLTVIGVKEFAMKMVSEEDVKSTQVNGHPAAWLEGPHTLQLFGNSKPNSLLIESNVLIWADEGMTYRLEGQLSEAEMIEIAESVSTGT